MWLSQTNGVNPNWLRRSGCCEHCNNHDRPDDLRTPFTNDRLHAGREFRSEPRVVVVHDFLLQERFFPLRFALKLIAYGEIDVRWFATEWIMWFFKFICKNRVQVACWMSTLLIYLGADIYRVHERCHKGKSPTWLSHGSATGQFV